MSPSQLENRAHISRAIRFSAINQVVNRIATFASGIIVMRILLPGDVGTFAAATAFVVFCTAFNDICMGPALIQWKGNLHQAAKSGATIAIGGSVFLYVIFYFLSPSIGNWLDDDQLSSVLRLLMLLVIIDGIGTVPLAVLTRKMRQKPILYIETISLAAQIIVTIVLAKNDFGPFSLVWGMVASNGLSTLMMFAIADEARLPGFHLDTAKKLIRFGSMLAVSNVFRVSTQYFDNLVVSATQGTTQLGYYQLGYNGGNLPENTVGATVGRVSFAWFSEIRENDKHRRKAFHDLTLGLVATTLPFVMVLSVLSTDIVQVLYGDKWRHAANIVRILAILGGIRVFLNFFADIFAANGKPHLELQIFSLWFAALIPALIIGSLVGGITGVAIAHVMVASLVIIPLVMFNLSKQDFPVAQTFKDSIVLVIGAICQGIVMFSISQMIESPFISLIISGAAGAGVFILVTFKVLKQIKKTFTDPSHGFSNLDETAAETLG